MLSETARVVGKRRPSMMSDYVPLSEQKDVVPAYLPPNLKIMEGPLRGPQRASGIILDDVLNELAETKQQKKTWGAGCASSGGKNKTIENLNKEEKLASIEQKVPPEALDAISPGAGAMQPVLGPS